jgi:hypothetical protein
MSPGSPEQIAKQRVTLLTELTHEQRRTGRGGRRVQGL